MKKQISEAILQDYLKDYSLELGLSEATVYSKRGTLRRFIKWLGSKQFSAKSCREWVRRLNDKGYKSESIKHEVRVIRATIRFLYKRKFIDKDFALEIPSPKVPRKQLEIVPAEVAEKIIIAGTTPGKGDNCINKKRKKEYRQALRFVLRTGLRSRELRDLRGKDINLEEETYFVRSKSGSIDVLPIPKDMLGELKKRKDRVQLFKVTAKTLNNSLKRGCKRLDISTKVRTHTLRHIFCTSLLKRGVPLQIVSRLMRHSSVAITDKVYSHYQIDDLRHSLNSSHPLIMRGLTTLEVLKSLDDLISKSDIKSDKRFLTEIKQTKGELSIKIQEISL